MTLLFLLCFGEFTYTAPAGTWLDYARTGPLSAHRFLVVQQNGEKGQYDQGATQMVLDEDGAFLYEMPEAANAWVVRNGLLGDEDLFLFMDREKQVWEFWHPQFGARTLTIEGAGRPVVPGQIGRFRQFFICKGGTRMVLISDVPKTDQGKAFETALEVVDFPETLDAMFRDGPIQAAGYTTQKFNHNFMAHVDHEILRLWDMQKHIPLYFSMDFSVTDLRTLSLAERKTAFPILGLTAEQGLLSYVAYTPEVAVVVAWEDREKPLFVLREADKAKPGYTALQDFADALGSGYLAATGDVMTVLRSGKLLEFDPEAGTLTTYRATSEQALRRPDVNRVVSCDAGVLRVQNRGTDHIDRSKPLATVDVSAFQLP